MENLNVMFRGKAECQRLSKFIFYIKNVFLIFWLHQSTDKERTKYWLKMLFFKREYHEDITDFARMSCKL